MVDKLETVRDVVRVRVRRSRARARDYVREDVPAKLHVLLKRESPKLAIAVDRTRVFFVTFVLRRVVADERRSSLELDRRA